MRFFPCSGLLVLVLLAGNAFGRDRPAPPRRDLDGRPGSLRPGDAAPDFTLQDVRGKETTRLSDLRGKPVVLFFGSCT